MMMRTIRPPESKQATTLLVAVRCRPITSLEKEKSRDILRVIDEKVVVVLDPDVTKEYLDRVQNRSKEKRYAFDVAFGGDATNQDVYRTTVGSMVEGVVRGLNATVFAYGATGSGKTHTMAGTPDDPGLMVLSMQTIFHLIGKHETEYEFDVTCSYLEVYNEVIYDLLEVKSGHLELREDPDQGITVAGLKRIQVSSAEKILELLHQGNSRRKTESTDANATSSRSHAVLEIIVKRKERNQYRAQVLRGRLALVDLAGSERASETHNAGQKLRDGANINRSLLALANCINALGKQQKKGLAYVPYRNSKLTRLLKDGLSGNSRTIMVATVSSGDDQYHQTINTLKYADRAKEIKTHIQTNVGTVDAHVADYQRMIDNLQVEVSQLRRELAEKESQLTAKSSEMRADDELSWLDVLSQDINDNVEERINLQKALFELEDTNLHNRAELQQLDDVIGEAQSLGKEEDKAALNERRQVVLDNIRDNDEAGAHYREDIELNEGHRRELQRMIDKAISSDRNKTFLRILSQYRLLGMTNMELQFQMAVRDQIIQDQKEALKNLWLMLECSGLNRHQILKIAAQQGIIIEDGIIPTRGGGGGGGGGGCGTPIPALHKQQSFSPGGPPRHSGAMSAGLAARDNHNNHSSSRAWSDSSARDEYDTPSSSPKTPNPEWRHLRSVHHGGGGGGGGGGGYNWQVWSNGGSRAQSARSKFQEVTPDRMVLSMDGSSVSYNGSSGWHSPEKAARAQGYSSERCCLAVRPSSVRLEQQQQQQQSNLLFRSRGRSPPQILVQEENAPLASAAPPARQKRRPRSAESQSRQSKWGAERGSGREKDRASAGSAAPATAAAAVAAAAADDCQSEGSGVDEAGSEPTDCPWTAAALRHSDKCSNNALDNDMLRKELSRLNNELQGMRRGADAMQWNALSAAAQRSAGLAELPFHRCAPPAYPHGVKLPATAPPSFAPHFRSVDPTDGHQSSSVWDASSAWPRAAPAAAACAQPPDAIGRPCVASFGSGEKQQQQQQNPVLRMKLRIDRRKLRIESVSGPMKRQAWPSNVVEWK